MAMAMAPLLPRCRFPSCLAGFQTAYAADLNGDGKTDLLAVDNDGQEFSVTVFLNGGKDLLLLPEQFQLAP